jgi:hypothetical protein
MVQLCPGLWCHSAFVFGLISRSESSHLLLGVSFQWSATDCIMHATQHIQACFQASLLLNRWCSVCPFHKLSWKGEILYLRSRDRADPGPSCIWRREETAGEAKLLDELRPARANPTRQETTTNGWAAGRVLISTSSIDYYPHSCSGTSPPTDASYHVNGRLMWVCRTITVISKLSGQARPGSSAGESNTPRKPPLLMQVAILGNSLASFHSLRVIFNRYD